jgi:hypothetical protein
MLWKGHPMQTPPRYADRLQTFPFHIYWHALPDIEASYQINPFSYAQRMEGYKLLMGYMNDKGVFGADNEHNPFWGFVSQLDWQWRTGRLKSPLDPQASLPHNLTPRPPLQNREGEKDIPDIIQRALTDEIAPDSWWGCCNYTLSVIPMIAAMQVGIMPQLEVLLPKTNDLIELKAPDSAHHAMQAGINTAPDMPLELKFAQGGGDAGGYSVPGPLKKAVEAWRAFFKLVKQAKPGTDLEPLRMAIWDAHLITITAATKLYMAELRLLPRREQEFGRGWIRMVDFLGASAWKTDLVFLVEQGQGNLPPRILQDSDIPGRIADLDAATNHSLVSIFKLGKMNRWRFRFNRWLWKRAMRTRDARDIAPRLLRASLDPAPEYNEDRKLLRGYIRARVPKEN